MDYDVMNSDSMRFYVARALTGQTPSTLLAISYSVDEANRMVHLKAHFDGSPSEADQDDVLAVEGEVAGDFPSDYNIESEFELISPSGQAHPLGAGFCYVRPG